jgi:hypothetical protein
MAELKETPKPFFTTEKVKLYAPKGAKHHAHQEEVSVQARQKEKFLKLGYAETKEEAADAEAHPAISITQPPAKPTKGKKAADEDLDKDKKPE